MMSDDTADDLRLDVKSSEIEFYSDPNLSGLIRVDLSFRLTCARKVKDDDDLDKRDVLFEHLPVTVHGKSEDSIDYFILEGKRRILAWFSNVDPV